MESPINAQPSIHLLTPEAVECIHADSLKILVEVGIRIDSALARRVFKAASGVTFRDDLHVTFQPEIVEWAIQTAPATIDIYNRK